MQKKSELGTLAIYSSSSPPPPSSSLLQPVAKTSERVASESFRRQWIREQLLLLFLCFSFVFWRRQRKVFRAEYFTFPREYPTRYERSYVRIVAAVAHTKTSGLIHVYFRVHNKTIAIYSDSMHMHIYDFSIFLVINRQPIWLFFIVLRMFLL